MSTSHDDVYATVHEMIDSREMLGMQRYKRSIVDNPQMTLSEWVTMAWEEVADAMVYLAMVDYQVRDVMEHNRRLLRALKDLLEFTDAKIGFVPDDLETRINELIKGSELQAAKPV